MAAYRKRITWTDAEWDAVVAALLAARPQIAQFPLSVTARDMDAAITTLPADRQRPTHGVIGPFRSGVEQAIRRLEGSTDKESLTVEAPAKKRVFWSKAEYLAMARKLYQRNKILLDSSTLTGLGTADVHFAQQILPPERHRLITNMPPERVKFLEAFTALRPILEQETKHAVAFNEANAELAAARAALDAEVAQRAAVNPYEAAFRPMVELMMNEFFARLTPILMANQCEASQGTPTVDISGLMAGFRAGTSKATATVTRAKPRIGVVGPKGNQAEELKRTFPQFDFVIEHGGNTSQICKSMHSVDKIIGMVGFMRHDLEHALMRDYSERYSRVNGSVSAIKRHINQWIHQGVLA